MHAGSLTRDTTAARVYRHLAEYRGRWLTTMEIGRATGSQCTSTRISEVRAQLPEGERIDRRQIGLLHQYRLVNVGQGDLWEEHRGVSPSIPA
jgi:hypothetical protein